MSSPEHVELGQRLTAEVLAPMKAAFVGKDEIIDLLGISLVAGEHLFLLGPPGTAKSALVQDLARRIHGRVFDYLLTRFTEPNELFGPFDIRRLREGDLVTNTEGMLPEASLVFLDELLNANSAILNSLLMVLNERVFRRGRETRLLPLLMVVSASNRLPGRRRPGGLVRPLPAPRALRQRGPGTAQRRAGSGLEARSAAGGNRRRIRYRRHPPLESHVGRRRSGHGADGLRRTGPSAASRRHSHLRSPRGQVAAAAGGQRLLCGRLAVNATDLWVLRYIWDTEEQQEVLASIVQDAIDRSGAEREASHPRAQGGDAPDPECLARDLQHIAQRAASGDLPATEKSYLKDRLGLLAARCQWVKDPQQREFLEKQVEALWKPLGVAT